MTPFLPFIPHLGCAGLFYGGLVSETSVVSTMMMSFGTMAVISVAWCVCNECWTTPLGISITERFCSLRLLAAQLFVLVRALHKFCRAGP